jgi:hypothetical protein
MSASAISLIRWEETNTARPPAADPDGLQQRDELWAVALLARAEDPAGRAAAAIRG